MRQFTADEVAKVFTDKGYTLRNTPGTINIFGVRNNDTRSDLFDDCVGILYMWFDKWTILQYEATTDPGVYYRTNPINKDGTAIIVPGQYKEVYKVGLHDGYEAMQQISPIKYVRDNNKDNILNFLYKVPGFKSFIQLAATNIHHAGTDSKVNWNWSAGCQVLKKLEDFLFFMNRVKSLSKWPDNNKYDYTLLEIEDFKNGSI